MKGTKHDPPPCGGRRRALEAMEGWVGQVGAQHEASGESEGSSCGWQTSGLGRWLGRGGAVEWGESWQRCQVVPVPVRPLGPGVGMMTGQQSCLRLWRLEPCKAGITKPLAWSWGR